MPTERSPSRRGGFKTVYDALQLDNCPNITSRPATGDVFVSPTFPTPTDGTVLYVDANVTVAGGDGSKANPFRTLAAAVAAAARLPTSAWPATVVLRAGVHPVDEAGIVLTANHSGLTIQNFEGESVAISGAVQVPTATDRWSLHRAATNTWRLDLNDWAEIPEESFGMRVGLGRASDNSVNYNNSRVQ